MTHRQMNHPTFGSGTQFSSLFKNKSWKVEDVVDQYFGVSIAEQLNTEPMLVCLSICPRGSPENVISDRNRCVGTFILIVQVFY